MLAALHDPQAIRHAGRELLSLALIDSRNHLLQRLAQGERPVARRLALQAVWHQEHWIACHVQRGRGEDGDADASRLAGSEPALAAWLRADDAALPEADRVRELLAQTLDITLDLLATTREDDVALHVFRQCLQHEDRLCETLDEQLRLQAPPARAQRSALWLPAQRWLLGSTDNASAAAGFVPWNERWAHAVALPEFEIDAQPVNWAQYVEFAEDRGHDRAELWSAEGWAWAQAQGRRAPLHVEQLRGAVVVMRGQGLAQAAAAQPVMHVTRHEAEAWCRWAGRRLPTEPEWELAASTAASRGFVWGDVLEWVAGSARLWPGAPKTAPPGTLDAMLEAPTTTVGVLRGASFATRTRWRHPKARRFAAPHTDTAFCGFRSCAL